MSLSNEAVLFEKCPLCGQAKITVEKPRLFSFSKPKVNPCPKCFAEFVDKGSDKYQLVFCEPHKLVGRHNCGDRVFRGCYLDVTLSRQEWQKIAEGGESEAFSKFLDLTKRYCQGALPTYPSEQLPFTLESGEIVHYVSSPVYLDEQKPSKGKTTDKGVFFLTDRRIIFVHALGMLVLRLDGLERVDDSPPGFLVKEKSSFEPVHFFPPAYDPVFAAVCGAIHNLKRKG